MGSGSGRKPYREVGDDFDIRRVACGLADKTQKSKEKTFTISYETKDQVSKTRKSEVIKYELEIKGKKISVFIFGIGNFDWNNIIL